MEAGWQVFATRFSLHAELYQHRVVAAVTLMLRDALLLADSAPQLTITAADGSALRLSECARDRLIG